MKSTTLILTELFKKEGFVTACQFLLIAAIREKRKAETTKLKVAVKLGRLERDALLVSLKGKKLTRIEVNQLREVVLKTEFPFSKKALDVFNTINKR